MIPKPYFILDNRTLFLFSKQNSSIIGQGSTISPELDSAIGILSDINVFTLKTPVFLIILK